jgi:hypothetical protein
MAQVDDRFAQWLEQTFGSTARGGLPPPESIQIRQYWAKLPEGQKETILRQLSAPGSNPSAVQAVIQKLVSAPATPPPASATTTPPPGSPAAASQQAVTAAALPAQQLTEQTGVGPGAGAEGIPVMGTQGSIGGFNEQLATFNKNQFATAQNDPSQLAQLAGVTPEQLQSQYQSYLTGMQAATQGNSQLLAHQRTGNQGAAAQLTLAQFAQVKAQNMIGSWSAVLSAMNGIYEAQFRQAMPPELIQQVITALNGMSPDQQKNVLYNAQIYMENMTLDPSGKSLRDQVGTYAANLLTSLPPSIMTYTQGAGTSTGSIGSGGIVGTYEQVHPSPFLQGETIQQGIAAAFEKAFNRSPTAGDMKALGSNPTPAQIQTYIDNQPMPGYNMTYGAFTAASSQLTPLWQQYFGHDPTPTQLKWAVGKSSQDITDFIDNSASSVPGVTIGVKNNYETFINSLDTSGATTHAFSAGVDDSLIKSLHDHLQSQSTATPTPGKM